MTWKYLDLVNGCIQILLTIGIGYACAHFGILDPQNFVALSTKFVFYVALPSLVVRSLGIGIDFWDERFSWAFIGAFLLLRAVFLLLSVGWYQTRTDKGIGHVAVRWLSLTWISTVIVGIPISVAVFGSKQLGQFYGLLAAISSFIFQLPFQLSLLECHLIGNRNDRVDIKQGPSSENHEEIGNESKNATSQDEEASDELVVLPMEAEPTPTSAPSYTKLFAQQQIWTKVGKALLHNPVLWAIAIGFFLSLTKIGPKYFNPNSSKYVTGLGWAWELFGWLGDCVSPVSLVAMGCWMQGQERILLISPNQAMFCMSLKLVLVPFVMVGLALMVDLKGNNGRAAVLIAALPISLASFSLAAQYEIGEQLLSTNVMLGTLLLLPTMLVWNLVLDAMDLFPITKVG